MAALNHGNHKAGNHTGLPLRIGHDTKEKIQKKPSQQQTLHILPTHLQTDGECRCCQVSPLLPIFPQTNKTRVYMETDESGALKPDLPDVPRLDSARCTGCGRCVAACTLRLITLEVSGFRKSAALNNAGQCTRCGECVKSCLLNAVETT